MYEKTLVATDLTRASAQGLRHATAHAALGSIAEKLIRQAPCPVVCVRAGVTNA